MSKKFISDLKIKEIGSYYFYLHFGDNDEPQWSSVNESGLIEFARTIEHAVLKSIQDLITDETT